MNFEVFLVNLIISKVLRETFMNTLPKISVTHLKLVNLIAQDNLVFSTGVRWRHYFKNMDSIVLQPPESVRGITILDKELFKKKIQVPSLQLKDADININKIIPLIKTKFLKLDKLKPVQSIGEVKLILLHPLGVKEFKDLPVTKLKELNITEESFKLHELELGYDNWRADELLKSILPVDQEQLTSFSRVGHIIHLNLREHLLPFKQIIAQILHEKIKGTRTVVNKAQSIDNTYRTFELELLSGESDYRTTVKENGATYEFDFSSVYWNPRLSMEHERIVTLLSRSDVLYDVFAGVGPFSVPAGRKGCQVFANDLNPESFQWLKHNVQKNKIGHLVKTFNKDGKQFILEDLKLDLINRVKENQRCHVVMNLPALATTFLNAFVGLLTAFPELEVKNLITVHVYCFTQCENNKTLAQELAETGLGVKLLPEEIVAVNFVRSVAPNKDMMRVDFNLTTRILKYTQTVKHSFPHEESGVINGSKSNKAHFHC